MREIKDFDSEKRIYIGKVLGHIHHKKLHTRIYEEISNHMDDMYDDFKNDFDNELDVAKKVIDEMGDPEELGNELKKAHKDTLRFIKTIRIITIFAIFALIVSAFGFFESKDNIKAAKAYELTEETVELEKSLITYTGFEEYSFINDIHWYTNIDWHHLGIVKPIYKVKEHNLFDDYYILDKSQSVVVDLTCAIHGLGKIYVDDIRKLPADYHSDKLSKVVLTNYDTDFSLELNLTSDEILELEKIAFLNDNDIQEDLEFGKLVMSGENEPYYWCLQFHIKDLEGLYYYPWYDLYKSIDGKYYIGDWWYGAEEGHMYLEIPEHLAKKIDKSFEDAGISFKNGQTFF